MIDATKKADRYNYFPFVSGDLIEKHRATLGAQLKNDLQSYLDYSKRGNNKIPIDFSQNDSKSITSSRMNT
jgi:hypothetical protein